MVLTWFGFNSGDRDAGSPQWSTPQKPDDLVTFPVSLPIGNLVLTGSPSDKDKLLNLAFAAQAELVFQLDDATWEVAL